MRMTLRLVVAAGGLMAAGAMAQMAPSPPPPGGGMMRADANGDGSITRAEMIAEAEARFTAMDRDKDGSVTAEEREAARTQRRGKAAGGTAGGAAGGAPGSAPRGGGYGMRGDADGVVTRTETVQRAGTRFDRLDTNRDGKLDTAELAAMRPMRGARGGRAMPAPNPSPAQ